MIDINQVFLISGLFFIFLFIVVLPKIFQSKRARISRHFRQNKDIRIQLVKKLSEGASALPNDLSQSEMVALLTFIYVKETVSDSFAAFQKFTTIGWEGKFNDDFYNRLDSTARAFSAKRWNRESIDLFRLGQMIAQSNNNSNWSREFKNSIERLQYQQVQSGLPTRMK